MLLTHSNVFKIITLKFVGPTSQIFVGVRLGEHNHQLSKFFNSLVSHLHIGKLFHGQCNQHNSLLSNLCFYLLKTLMSIVLNLLMSSGIYKNNGYLMVSCNGGLNQMRAAVSLSLVYRLNQSHHHQFQDYFNSEWSDLVCCHYL